MLFGSFYRAFYCLDELFHGRIKNKVKVVGVASDEVTGKETKMLWKYTMQGRTFVEDLVRAHG